MDGATSDNPNAAARLRVLASGSSGNCSVLVVPGPSKPTVLLIDAGLSPRKTGKLLAKFGIQCSDISAILLTHLDHDHWHSGWRQAMPGRASVWLSERHEAHGRRHRLMPEGRSVTFKGEVFEPAPGVCTRVATASHDDLGVSSFRFDIHRRDAGAFGSLGFATDLGRVPETVVDCMRSVDVLAIESNYCPELQAASDRPWYLKKRIMGGSGHLSNEQSAEAVRAIGPRRHVVLLHLSRECNRPELAAAHHSGASYQLTVSSQESPSPWVDIAGDQHSVRTTKPRVGEQMTMFSIGV